MVTRIPIDTNGETNVTNTMQKGGRRDRRGLGGDVLNGTISPSPSLSISERLMEGGKGIQMGMY